MTGQQVFFAQMMSYTVQYDIIYHPFPINSQYLKTWGVDSLDQVSLKGMSVKPTKIK